MSTSGFDSIGSDFQREYNEIKKEYSEETDISGRIYIYTDKDNNLRCMKKAWYNVIPLLLKGKEHYSLENEQVRTAIQKYKEQSDPSTKGVFNRVINNYDLSHKYSMALDKAEKELKELQKGGASITTNHFTPLLDALEELNNLEAPKRDKPQELQEELKNRMKTTVGSYIDLFENKEWPQDLAEYRTRSDGLESIGKKGIKIRDPVATRIKDKIKKEVEGIGKESTELDDTKKRQQYQILIEHLEEYENLEKISTIKCDQEKKECKEKIEKYLETLIDTKTDLKVVDRVLVLTHAYKAGLSDDDKDKIRLNIKEKIFYDIRNLETVPLKDFFQELRKVEAYSSIIREAKGIPEEDKSSLQNDMQKNREQTLSERLRSELGNIVSGESNKDETYPLLEKIMEGRYFSVGTGSDGDEINVSYKTILAKHQELLEKIDAASGVEELEKLYKEIKAVLQSTTDENKNTYQILRRVGVLGPLQAKCEEKIAQKRTGI